MSDQNEAEMLDLKEKFTAKIKREIEEATADLRTKVSQLEERIAALEAEKNK